MSSKEKVFTTEIVCGHCGNTAPMEIVAQDSHVKTHDDPSSPLSWDEGFIYELVLCPACKSDSLRRYYWHEFWDPAEIKVEVLYPTKPDVPVGLPDSIARALEAANKVRNIDANAYGVLLGRLLELVCKDRNADGKSLMAKLRVLSTKGEIPQNLIGVADGLRNLRNVAAHAVLGELTPAELPILDMLCKAIVEYVYSAPFLAKQAEELLDDLKKKQSGS